MSSLKHEIRHKQAQFNSLETTLLRGPRPTLIPMSSNTSISVVPDFASSAPSSYLKRHSMESLSSSYRDGHSDIYGANGHSFSNEGIKEGVPATFGNGISPKKRSGSPTRTWSRACFSLKSACPRLSRCICRNSRQLGWYVFRASPARVRSLIPLLPPTQ
jgi:hypothetical protein